MINGPPCILSSLCWKLFGSFCHCGCPSEFKGSQETGFSALLLTALADLMGGLSGAPPKAGKGHSSGAGNGSASFSFRVSLSRSQIRVLTESLWPPSEVAALHLFVQMRRQRGMWLVAQLADSGVRIKSGSHSLLTAILPFIQSSFCCFEGMEGETERTQVYRRVRDYSNPHFPNGEPTAPECLVAVRSWRWKLAPGPSMRVRLQAAFSLPSFQRGPNSSS